MARKHKDAKGMFANIGAVSIDQGHWGPEAKTAIIRMTTRRGAIAMANWQTARNA